MMMILMLIFWVLVIIALIYAIRWFISRGKPGGGPPGRA